MLYEFKLGHNITEASKSICCVKGENTVNYITVTRWFKNFCSGCKNLDNEAKLGRPESIDSEPVLQVIVANLASIRQVQHLTVQCGFSPSWPWQMYMEQPNCVSCYQNIAKLLTCPNIFRVGTGSFR